MRVKCRGYEGNLISFDATESVLRNTVDGVSFCVAWYDIEIRSDDGAKIGLSRVKESEIEVMHG